MLKNVNFKVTGMHCGSCSQLITMELSDVEGITGVTVDQKSGIGSVTLTKESLTEHDVVLAIERAGYKGDII
jgi:copper chaperone CopZ